MWCARWVGYCVLGGLAGYVTMQLRYRQLFDCDVAVLLVDSGYFAEAEQMLRSRLRRVPRDSQARILLARSQAGQGDISRCIESLALITDESPLKPEALLREGQAYLEIHDSQRAESALRRCTESQAVSRETAQAAWQKLARIFGVKDRTEDLRAALWSLYAIVGEEGRMRIRQQLLNSTLVREEPLTRAKTLEDFVQGNASDVEARVALGLAYLEANQLRKGMEIVRECVRQNPRDPNAWRAWLRAVYQEGELEKLAIELDRAPVELQEQSGYWKLRAIVAQNSKQWEQASECLARAIEIDPASADLNGQYATVLARLGKQPQAETYGAKAKQLRDAQNALRAAYEDWLYKDPADATESSMNELLQRIVRAYREMGLFQEAEAWAHVSVNTF
jgi:tetratricopeptide (TPR) repeat protein